MNSIANALPQIPPPGHCHQPAGYDTDGGRYRISPSFEHFPAPASSLEHGFFSHPEARKSKTADDPVRKILENTTAALAKISSFIVRFKGFNTPLRHQEAQRR